MGVKKTCVVKFIRKGDTGAKGEQGAVLRGPQAWSDCATGYAFKQGAPGEAWLDVVLYNDYYYYCKKSHVKTCSNYPGSTTAENQGLWQLGDSIGLVATRILLAQYALVKNLGVEVIDMRDSGGNIIFQAKDGNVTCKTGTFENVNITGTVRANVFYQKISRYYVSDPVLQLPTDVGQVILIYAVGQNQTTRSIYLPAAASVNGQMLDIYGELYNNIYLNAYASGNGIVDVRGNALASVSLVGYTRFYSDGSKWIRLQHINP